MPTQAFCVVKIVAADGLIDEDSAVDVGLFAGDGKRRSVVTVKQEIQDTLFDGHPARLLRAKTRNGISPSSWEDVAPGEALLAQRLVISTVPPPYPLLSANALPQPHLNTSISVLASKNGVMPVYSQTSIEPDKEVIQVTTQRLPPSPDCASLRPCTPAASCTVSPRTVSRHRSFTTHGRSLASSPHPAVRSTAACNPQPQLNASAHSHVMLRYLYAVTQQFEGCSANPFLYPPLDSCQTGFGATAFDARPQSISPRPHYVLPGGAV